MFMNSYKEMYKGITAHVPRSFVLALSKQTFFALFITYNSWFQLLLFCEYLHLPGLKPRFPYIGVSDPNSTEKTWVPIN